jgi:hypothetical protein
MAENQNELEKISMGVDELTKLANALRQRNDELAGQLQQMAHQSQKLMQRMDEMGAVLLGLIVDKLKTGEVSFKIKRLNKLIRQFKLERMADENRVSIKVSELPKAQQLPTEDEPANDDQEPGAESGA